MQVRFAIPDDAAIIHRFVCELAEYERAPQAVLATPETYRAQLAERPAPFECLIAEEQGPIGFALFFFTYSTWRGQRGIHLEDLFVAPAARRRGAGRLLFERVAAIAVERQCARLEWSVLDWNEPAIAFYRSLGAKPLDEWTTWRLDL